MKYLLLTRRGENAETRLKLLTKQEREQTFELSKDDEYLWTGRWRERRESCSPVNVQRIKLKSVYNYYVQRWNIYAPIPSMCNQSILIDINLSIDCYWKSIPIDNHTNLRHRLVIDYQYQSINRYQLVLIDIDCHRLSISSIGYPGLSTKHYLWTYLSGPLVTLEELLVLNSALLLIRISCMHRWLHLDFPGKLMQTVIFILSC